MKSRTLGQFLFFSLLLAGLQGWISCAPPLQEKQSFVSKRDISTVSLFREGLNYYKRGRFVEAEFKLRQALVLYPEAENIWADLAVVLKSQGEYDEARVIYQKLMNEYPDSLQNVLGLAHLFYTSGEYEKAAKYFEQALALALNLEDRASAVMISRSLSVLYFTIGDEEEALDYSHYALNLTNDTEQLFRHVKLLNALGFYDQVEQLLSGGQGKSRRVKSESRLLHQLALAYFGSEKYDQAAKVEELAVRIVGDDYETEYEISVLTAVLERVLKEIEAQKRAETGQAGEDAKEDLISGEKDEEEDEEDELSLDSNLLALPITLYWPPNLLEHLQEMIAEQEEEEETGTTWGRLFS